MHRRDNDDQHVVLPTDLTHRQKFENLDHEAIDHITRGVA